MGMNVFEIKGIAGEAIGWNGRGADDSIDSFRFRNFGVDLTNGRGSQVDMSWDFDNNQGSASYSFIQALPQMGMFNFYPLAGVGIAAGEELVEGTGGDLDADQLRDRYNMHGTFYVAGMYAKMQLTDKIWLNYNPMYFRHNVGVFNVQLIMALRAVILYSHMNLQRAIKSIQEPTFVISPTGQKTPVSKTVITASNLTISFKKSVLTNQFWQSRFN